MASTWNITMKLIKTFVDKAPSPIDKDQIFYRDDQLKGFALRITSKGVKSFVVEKSIGNKIRRITLGKYGTSNRMNLQIGMQQ
jgi:hypothetical protein